jgi:hypothetical protein
MQEVEENKYERGERQPWDDITPEYLNQVSQKVKLMFEDEYEEALISYNVDHISISEIDRLSEEIATFIINIDYNPTPDYGKDTMCACITLINSPVEYNCINITLFEDKVYEAVKEAIEKKISKGKVK